MRNYVVDQMFACICSFVGIVDMVEASLASFSYLLKGDEQIAQNQNKIKKKEIVS